MSETVDLSGVGTAVPLSGTVTEDSGGEQSELFDAGAELTGPGPVEVAVAEPAPVAVEEPVPVVEFDAGPSPAMVTALNHTTIPDNLQEYWDHDAGLRLYSQALEMGVEPETVAKLMNSWTAGQSERLPGVIEAAQDRADEQFDQAAEAHAAESRRVLQAEWKDGYEAKLQTAREVAANLFSDDEFRELLDIRLADGSLFGDNRILIKALAGLGGKMALKSSAELAQAQLEELEMDDKYQKHVFDRSQSPANRAARAKRSRLFERAYPEPAPPATPEGVTAEEKAAAKAELEAYTKDGPRKQELGSAVSNRGSPASAKDQQVLARWKELGRIANAPLVSPEAGASFAGKPIGSSQNQTTREQVLAEIGAIENHPALFDRNHPLHAALIAKKNALYKQVYPE